jgi:uncharacterized protein YcbX
MDRFRPNIVIRGGAPFAEDGWARLGCGNVEVDLVSPCARCAVTTVDQTIGRRTGPEPLRTLAQFHRGLEGVEFGWNAVHRDEGILSVGDRVEVLASRD